MRLTFMGRISRHALHAKCRILCGRGRLQFCFQKRWFWLLFEVALKLPGRDSLTSTAYALRTLKCPLGDSAQINLLAGNRELIGMLLMTTASYGRNKASRISNLQLAVLGFINSLTLVSGCRNYLGEVTLYVDEVGNHLWPQTRILDPLPTFHHSLFLTRFWAVIILRHVKDGLLPRDAWTNSYLGKSLSLENMINQRILACLKPSSFFF